MEKETWREEEQQLCKICLAHEGSTEKDGLYSFCSCRGTIKYMHRTCFRDMLLHTKRKAKNTCEHCRTEYRIFLVRPLRIFARVFSSLVALSVICAVVYACFFAMSCLVHKNMRLGCYKKSVQCAGHLYLHSSEDMLSLGGYMCSCAREHSILSSLSSPFVQLQIGLSSRLQKQRSGHASPAEGSGKNKKHTGTLENKIRGKIARAAAAAHCAFVRCTDSILCMMNDQDCLLYNAMYISSMILFCYFFFCRVQTVVALVYVVIASKMYYNIADICGAFVIFSLVLYGAKCVFVDVQRKLEDEIVAAVFTRWSACISASM